MPKPRILLLQNGAMVQDICRKWLTMTGLTEGNDFAIATVPEELEPLLVPGELQIFVTAEILSPERTREVASEFKSKNPRLIVATLSSNDLGEGFDLKIPKGHGVTFCTGITSAVAWVRFCRPLK